MPLTNFPQGVSSFGVPVMPGQFTGNAWFVDPTGGSDAFEGTSPDRAFATLYRAHAAAADGNNDVVYLISNGLATGTARLSTALAQTVTAAATAGTLTWSKNALHLVGVAAPSGNSRARIAPPTGTYTQATFGSGNFIVVSGSGCTFRNISAYTGFSTGGVNQISLTVTGSYNAFDNCAFLGMNDAASAADTGSRTLKVGSAGSGDNVFYRCVIGGDTTTRSVANASLELAGGTARNRFTECVFPFMTSNAGVLGILGTGNNCVDRWNAFERCTFINAIKSTSTQMTVLASFTTASPGGLLLFKDCDTIGMTKIGDTNGLANSYVSNVGGAATGGLDVNPS